MGVRILPSGFKSNPNIVIKTEIFDVTPQPHNGYAFVSGQREVKILEDLNPRGQMKLENKLSLQSSKLLFCDTDLLETKVYSEQYFNNYCDFELEKYALQNHYDLYILTDIDIPWVKDDLRDRPNNRKEMFLAFKQALIKYKKPYVLVSGNIEHRMKIAISEINKLLGLQ